MNVAPQPDTDFDSPGEDLPAQRSRWSRAGQALARWALRVGVGLLSVAIALTAFSVVYNAATAGGAEPPKNLTYVRTGDVVTRYRAWGDPHASGSPVVLVHGFVEDADIWSQVAPQLARQHYVQAYDMRGFGYTQRGSPYTLQALSDQLGQFLDARGVRRPVLVAHSLGAGVIAQFALEHPDRVGGIVFLDGDGIGSNRRSGRLWLPDPWRTTVFRLAVRNDWVIRHLVASQCGPRCPPLDEAGVDQWRRPLQVPGAEQALWSMAGQGLVGLSPAELRRVSTTHIPTAVIFGAEDSAFAQNSPMRTAERIGAGPPTIIPGAHHLALISNPSQVAEAIEALATHARPA